LIYACVAHKDTILAEHSNRKGNFAKVVKSILEQVPPSDNRMTYTFDQHYFHYVVHDSIVYLCMSDEEFGRRVPFVFLDDIKTRFQSTYGQRGKGAIAYGMQADFARIIAKQMDFFSNSQNADKIRQAKAELTVVKEVAISSIEKVIERGERIELLVDRTENLTATSAQFKKKIGGVEECYVVEECQVGDWHCRGSRDRHLYYIGNCMQGNVTTQLSSQS